MAENDGNGFESFHVKDPDGFDLQIGNGKGYASARTESPANARFRDAGAVRVDRVANRVARPPLVRRHELQGERLVLRNLLGWGPTYDEGSQNELMIGDVGDIIIRGGNPLDPAFGQGERARAAARIDHISFGISPWDTDGVKAELEKRGLPRDDRHVGRRARSTSRNSRAITRRRRTATICRSATTRTTRGWRCRTPCGLSDPCKG